MSFSASLPAPDYILALPYEGYTLTAHVWRHDGWFVGTVPEMPDVRVQETSLELAAEELLDAVDIELEVGVMYGLFRS